MQLFSPIGWSGGDEPPPWSPLEVVQVGLVILFFGSAAAVAAGICFTVVPIFWQLLSDIEREVCGAVGVCMPLPALWQEAMLYGLSMLVAGLAGILLVWKTAEKIFDSEFL